MQHIVWLLLVVICWKSSSINGAKQMGCYRNHGNHQTCKLINKEKAHKLYSKRLSNYIANAIEYLRETTHNDFMVSSDILQAFSLAGFMNDGRKCSKTFSNELTKIKNATNDVANLSGGKLAHLLIGLKASCYDNAFTKPMLSHLRKKLLKFPQGEFNNYFQYSLAMIALYVHGKELPANSGKKLLQGWFIGKQRVHRSSMGVMSDTDAMGLMALYIVVNQKFTPHWVRKHAMRELKKAGKKLDDLTKAPSNFVTTTLALQTFSRTSSPLSTSVYCEPTVDWLLKRQGSDGSFGGIKQTAWAVIALTGKSILDVRNTQCPLKEDAFDKDAYRSFVRSYRKKKKKETLKKSAEKEERTEPVHITLTLTEQISGSEKKVLAENVKITVLNGSNALQVLKEASLTNACFIYETKMTSWGEMIKSICNIQQSHAKKAYWSFYVNGAFAKVGASKYIVKENDFIEFSYKQFAI